MLKSVSFVSCNKEAHEKSWQNLSVCWETHIYSRTRVQGRLNYHSFSATVTEIETNAIKYIKCGINIEYVFVPSCYLFPTQEDIIIWVLHGFVIQAYFPWCFSVCSSHLVLGRGVVQCVQLPAELVQLIINVVHLSTQALVLPKVGIKLSLIIMPLSIRCYLRVHAGGQEWGRWCKGMNNRATAKKRKTSISSTDTPLPVTTWAYVLTEALVQLCWVQL